MRYFSLLLLFLICTVCGYTQTTLRSRGVVEVTFTKGKKPKKIFIKAEIIAPFPGGDSAWIQSLEKKLNETVQYKNGSKPGIYVVSIGFILSKEGHVLDVVVLNKPVGYNMEANVISAIKFKVNWDPSHHKGRTVQPLRTSSSTPPINN